MTTVALTIGAPIIALIILSIVLNKFIKYQDELKAKNNRGSK
jgi:hypothetical protein